MSLRRRSGAEGGAHRADDLERGLRELAEFPDAELARWGQRGPGVWQRSSAGLGRAHGCPALMAGCSEEAPALAFVSAQVDP